jgi:four helix bundle protein
MFKFEKLDVWQKAVEYADLVYKVTQTLPTEERYGLTSQLRRSAVSVSSNIAEGSSRSSETDLARFIEIAYGSLLESVSELEVARRQGFLSQDSFRRVYEGAETVARQLSAFRRTLQNSKP